MRIRVFLPILAALGLFACAGNTPPPAEGQGAGPASLAPRPLPAIR